MRLMLFLIAAFCRLAKLLSYSEHMRWLVGAVGIELKATLKARKFRTPDTPLKSSQNYSFSRVGADLNLSAF